VMVAPIISILSDSSKESVGSHAPRLILFGAIPAIIPIIPEVPTVPSDPIVAPEAGTVLVVSPTRADGESEPAEQRPVSSSHDTLAPLSEFTLSLIVSPPGIRRRSATVIRPDSSSSSSSSDPSSVHSSRCDSSGQAHSGPSTRYAPPRLIYPPVLTQRYSEAFRRWRATPLSTLYPRSTSESSLGSSSERSLDSSLPSSRLSRKRCRSPTASVPSSTHVSRSMDLTPTDLLPLCKRFRDSYLSKDSGKEHIEVDTADVEAVADVGISEGVAAHPEDGVGMGFEIAASDVREDDEEFKIEASMANIKEIVVDPLAISDSYKSSRGGIPDLIEDTIYDIVHYMLEVRIDRITEIETTQRRFKPC
ncbi:hypothetical protein Tco_1136730, partial [Tanacetum coccineum]